jgi:hypothetical protein
MFWPQLTDAKAQIKINGADIEKSKYATTKMPKAKFKRFSEKCVKVAPSDCVIRGLYYKTFYGRNFWMFILS